MLINVTGRKGHHIGLDLNMEHHIYIQKVSITKCCTCSQTSTMLINNYDIGIFFWQRSPWNGEALRRLGGRYMSLSAS